MATASTSSTPNRMSVSCLQSFLVDRGVVVTGLRKAELSDLVSKARDIDLDFDPDGLYEDREDVISAKLSDGDQTKHKKNKIQIICILFH